MEFMGVPAVSELLICCSRRSEPLGKPPGGVSGMSPSPAGISCMLVVMTICPAGIGASFADAPPASTSAPGPSGVAFAAGMLPVDSHTRLASRRLLSSAPSMTMVGGPLARRAFSALVMRFLGRTTASDWECSSLRGVSAARMVYILRMKTRLATAQAMPMPWFMTKNGAVCSNSRPSHSTKMLARMMSHVCHSSVTIWPSVVPSMWVRYCPKSKSLGRSLRLRCNELLFTCSYRRSNSTDVTEYLRCGQCGCGVSTARTQRHGVAWGTHATRTLTHCSPDFASCTK